MSLYSSVSSPIGEIPDYVRTHEIYDEAIYKDSQSLVYVPDHLQIQEIYEDVVWKMTQEMCEEVVSNGPYLLKVIADSVKTQEVCKDPWRKKKTYWNLSPTVPRPNKHVKTPQKKKQHCYILSQIILRHRDVC